MPISINLGRINTCKIVGTKDRFIENRCVDEAIPESWDCDPATGTCIDPGDGSGQWPDEATCIAQGAFVNDCVTTYGAVDSGVVAAGGGGAALYNWMAANGHHAVPTTNYMFESVPCPVQVTDPCPGPNGGCYYTINPLSVYDMNNVLLWSGNTINDLVTYLGTIGITILPTDTWSTIFTAIQTSTGVAKGGHFGVQGVPCGCTGCGSGHGASWDCVQSGGSSVCVDPGTGNGQYSSLAACNAALAAGTINACDTNSAAGGARVNAAAGTIFATEADAIEYYTDPANGISGTDASTLFFEIANTPSSTNPCSQGMHSHTDCCEGPNSTSGSPTYIMYLPYLYIQYGFVQPTGCPCNNISTVTVGAGAAACDCCPRGGFNSTNNQPISAMSGTCHPSYFTGDYLSLYGMNDLGVTQSWTWDAILTDAIAAGAPVTMSTPYSVNGNTQDVTAFLYLLWTWLDSNPSPWPDPDCHNCMTNNSCYQSCPNPSQFGGYTHCSRPTICLGTEICECQVSCTLESWDCDPATQTCYDPGTGLGQYSTHAACVTAGCAPPAASWDCDSNGNCVDPGNGTGQYSTLAACQSATGANTCSTATYTPAFAQPHCGAAANSVQYTYMVSNGFTNVPLTNYMWESCDPDSGQSYCLGPNGFEVFRFYNFQIFQQGIVVHSFPSTATIDDLVAWCNANIGPGFTNTMTWVQFQQHSYTFPGWEMLPTSPTNLRISHQACLCTDCGGTDLYDCVPGAGCQVVPGGQYSTLVACQAATAPTDTCDGTTIIPTAQADLATAWEELTINYPTVDISTISAQIITGGDPCRPPLSGTQTHCLGTDGHPMYKFGAYTFIDAQTGGPLTGLQASYVKWSDFLTDAQAIPIAGIGAATGFADACAAINTHYGSTTTDTCSMPLANYTISAPAVGPNPPNPAGCFSDCSAASNYAIGTNGVMQYISDQANGLTSAAPGSFNWQNCDTNGPSYDPSCSPTCLECSQFVTPDACPDGPNGCQYHYLAYWKIDFLLTPNGPFYNTWDLVLADLIAVGVTGVTATSTYDDVMGTINGQWCGQHGCGLLRQWAVANGLCNTYPSSNNCQCVGADGFASCPQVWGLEACCQCTTAVVTPECSVTSECCVCEEGGCPDPEPPSRGECLTLWLHADRSNIVTHPTYPAVPPNLGGTTYYVTEWHNLAYDSVAGVYPADPTAYYTFDTITPDFTTAPIFDDTTFAPNNAIMFDEQGIGAVSKFLIANPNGPAVLPLEPDTNPNTAYDKGWTVFFRRCTTEAGWNNDMSWLMGDDWTQTSPGSLEKASGLKPAGQPYCRSTMFGHNHANETANDHQYEASFINENTNTGDLYLPEGCYTHWITACETKPTGTANNTFVVTWGIGNQPLFKDTMKDVTMDLILENINTRNRNKLATQAGWYQEIRAYNCCFDKAEIMTEVRSIDAHWGPTLMPQGLPAPCGGSGAGQVIEFDGTDQTRVEVNEAGGNTTILPSNEGFTAAFWVRMNDCVDDDACFFEKGINLPTDNEQVAFRLFMTDDVGQAGNLYWDVFGDSPVDYLNNYSRTISNVAWLGESSCANLLNKWKHVAVTMDGLNGVNKKIYVNGVDVTGVTGGGSATISGNVRRNTEYPFVIGDSSRVDYTFKGDFSQFMTWNKALSAGEISDVYNNGAMFNPLTNAPSTMADILGIKPYEDKDRLTFYSNFDSNPITHETSYPYTITNYGGVTLDIGNDVDNALLPTDLEGLQCWFKAGTKMLFDLDINDNPISRATYMVGNTPHLKDKMRLWECHAGTGRYCAPDAVNTSSEKMIYQQSANTSIIEPGSLYTGGSKQLQIFHTKADGGIQFPAANGTEGAFCIMVKIRLETFANEAVYGNTTSNMLRVDSTTSVRIKIGGAGASTFTVPSAMTNAQPYIITIMRDAAGNLAAYIHGGAFTDQQLTGSFTDADAFLIDYIGGVPSQGMQGWVFDFLAWNERLNASQRLSMYRVINNNIKSA